jgi:hypothetical protein
VTDERKALAQVAADIAASSGQSFSRIYATLATAANIEAEAERRGAEAALRAAADAWYTDEGPDHPLSAVTWLRARADALVLADSGGDVL